MMRRPFAQTEPVFGSVAGLGLERRMGFIRKVYAAFLGSIFMLVAGVVSVLRVPGIGSFVANAFWVVVVAEFVALGAVLMLRNRTGLGFAAFGAFSLLTGLTTGLLVAQYLAMGQGATPHRGQRPQPLRSHRPALRRPPQG